MTIMMGSEELTSWVSLKSVETELWCRPTVAYVGKSGFASRTRDRLGPAVCRCSRRADLGCVPGCAVCRPVSAGSVSCTRITCRPSDAASDWRSSSVSGSSATGAGTAAPRHLTTTPQLPTWRHLSSVAWQTSVSLRYVTMHDAVVINVH